MKKLFLILVTAVNLIPLSKAQPAPPDSIAGYVKFLESQNLSAKDYIIGLYDRYDIVVFCERTHDELTQYNLLIDLFSDSIFYNQVGNIYMEMGGSNLDEKVNAYLFSENLSEDQINKTAIELQRKAMWYPLWDRYNYHYLLTGLYHINMSLPADKKMKLHPSDIAIDWKEMRTSQDVIEKIANNDVQNERDSVIGNNIVNHISNNELSDANRHKYFVILNSAHAVKGEWRFEDYHFKSAASYLFDRFEGRVANVLINMENLLNMTNTAEYISDPLPILDGKLDAAFEFVGNDNKGFDIKGSPLDHQRFENMTMFDTTLSNDEVFTGFVFYTSFPRQILVNGVPGLIDDSFQSELERRYKIWPGGDAYVLTQTKIDLVNRVTKKSPVGLASYWQKVMYWIGGGKGIDEFYKTAHSIAETTNFIKAEREKGSNSEYNVSESGINDFGHSLRTSGHDEDALAVFRLNMELFPNSGNTYDSYGDILRKLNRKNEAMDAYRKSLELNPENEHARNILKNLEE